MLFVVVVWCGARPTLAKTKFGQAWLPCLAKLGLAKLGHSRGVCFVMVCFGVCVVYSCVCCVCSVCVCVVYSCVCCVCSVCVLLCVSCVCCVCYVCVLCVLCSCSCVVFAFVRLVAILTYNLFVTHGFRAKD